MVYDSIESIDFSDITKFKKALWYLKQVLSTTKIVPDAKMSKRRSKNDVKRPLGPFNEAL